MFAGDLRFFSELGEIDGDEIADLACSMALTYRQMPGAFLALPVDELLEHARRTERLLEAARNHASTSGD